MYLPGFYILSNHPLIVAINEGPKITSQIDYFQKNISSDLSIKYIIKHVPWYSGAWHRMFRYKIKIVIQAYKGRQFHLMVNSQDEEMARKRFKICGGQFSTNIYINEHLYQPRNQPKLYDAVYTAQLKSFKRHWLAKNINNLMVVSYGGDLHHFCPELKHAQFNKEFLPRPELAKKYNQSHVGLCLSAEEGAMLASCEYLLSGIPVVSTYSKGGRDEFFNDENSRIVPPEPDAIAQAVQYWKKIQPDPYFIREKTLNKITHLRRSYCAYIANLIYQGGGGKKDPEELMEKYFFPPDGIHSRFVRPEDLGKVNLEEFSLD